MEGQYSERMVLEAMLPDAMKPMVDEFLHMQWSAEELQVFLDTARRIKDPVVQAGEDAILDRELEAAAAAGPTREALRAQRAEGKHVTVIRVSLTEVQKQYIREQFAGVTTIDYLQDQRGMTGQVRHVTHGVVHAARKAMNLQLFRQFSRKDSVVVEVGANIIDAMYRGEVAGKYFGCRPVLTAQDAARVTSQERAARIALKRTGRDALKPDQAAAAHHIVGRTGVMFGAVHVQDLDMAADVIVSSDANYDVPMRQMPAIMHRLGARMWVGQMLRARGCEFFVGAKSRAVPECDYVWSADTARDQIDFAFTGESSFGYSHSFSVYREYQMYPHRIFKYGQRTYVYEALPISNDIYLAFSMTLIEDTAVSDVPTLAFAPTGLAGMVTVHTFTVNERVAKGRAGRFVPAQFEVSEDMLTRVLQDVVSLRGKHTIEDVVKFTRSARLNIVHNGIRVSTSNPLPENLFRVFSVAVASLADDVLRSGKHDVSAVTEIIQRGFDAGSSMYDKAAAILSNVTYGSTTMVDAIYSKMSSLILDDKPIVRVVRCSAHVHYRNSPVVDFDAAAERTYEVRRCRCQELHDVEATLDGKHGGLSTVELNAVQQYADVLRRRVCTACKGTQDDAICALGVEAIEDEDVFYDVSEGDSCTDTSVSSTDGETVATTVESDGSDCDVCYAGAGVSPADAMALARVHRATYSDITTDIPVGRGPVRDSLCEYSTILELQMASSDDQARQYVKLALRCGQMTSRYLKSTSTDTLAHSLVHVGDGGVINGTSGAPMPYADFHRAYDWQTDLFHDVVTKPGTALRMAVGSVSSTLYTSTQYKIWNQPRILENVSKVLRDPLVGPLDQRYKFINGIFGAGKTSQIVRDYLPGQLYLSATLSSVKTVRKRLYGDSPQGLIYARTFDSVTTNGVAQFDVLTVDELPMSHAGQIFLILQMVRPRYVKFYGDFYQMPYVSFLSGFRMMCASMRGHCDVEFMPATHRTRLSVVAAVLDHYTRDSGICICSCCDRPTEEGVFLKKYTQLSEVPMREGIQYLTPRQTTKAALITRALDAGIFKSGGEPPVRTYAEAQGEQYANVICVRDDARAKPGSIYHEDFRANTGITRCEQTVTYYTNSDEVDSMVKFCRSAVDETTRSVVRDNTRRYGISVGLIKDESTIRNIYDCESEKED